MEVTHGDAWAFVVRNDLLDQLLLAQLLTTQQFHFSCLFRVEASRP